MLELNFENVQKLEIYGFKFQSSSKAIQNLENLNPISLALFQFKLFQSKSS